MLRTLLLATCLVVLGMMSTSCITEPQNPNLACLVGVHNLTNQPAAKVVIDGAVVMRNLRPYEEWVLSGTYMTGSYHTFEVFTTDTITSSIRCNFSVPWHVRYTCASTAVAVYIAVNPTNGDYRISE